MKSLNEVLSAPLTKISLLDLETDFSGFAIRTKTFLDKNFDKIHYSETVNSKIDLPSQLVVSAAIITGLTINSKCHSYSSGLAFTQKISTIFSLSTEDRETFLFVANLINLLLDEGYFRYKHVETLLNFHIGSTNLHTAIHRLFLYSKDKDFIFRPLLSPDLLLGLTFNEIVIAKTIFYLLQTFELRDCSKAPGRKPKFLASNLLTVETAYVEDVVLLYSALYAASDHYSTLYRRPFYVALTNTLGEVFVHNVD